MERNPQKIVKTRQARLRTQAIPFQVPVLKPRNMTYSASARL